MTAEQLELGQALKEDGMRRADENTDDWWRNTCDRAIAEAARTGKPFQAFDLCEWYGLPEPHSANAWGPRLAAAARRGVIEGIGWGPSSRPTTAKSAVRIWRGTTETLAESLGAA